VYGGLALAPLRPAFSSVSPLAVVTLIALFAALVFGWVTARGMRAPVRRAPAWACGTEGTARTQITASAFARPLGVVFRQVMSAGVPGAADTGASDPAIPGSAWLDRIVLRPIVQGVLWTSVQVRRLQGGNLHLYIAYVLVTLVALLLWGR
jgi:hydrogenase-4 component B